MNNEKKNNFLRIIFYEIRTVRSELLAVRNNNVIIMMMIIIIIL